MKMKIKLISALLAIFVSANAMEKLKPQIKDMIINPAKSLTFLAAVHIAQINRRALLKKLPEELSELVYKIRRIYDLPTDALHAEEKKLFINLLNDPKIDIEKAFPDLIKSRLNKSEIPTTNNLLNSILRGALSQFKYDYVQGLAAVNHDYVYCGQLAVELGAYNVNKASYFYGDTLLIFAALEGNIELVKMLINKNADVNIENHNHENALIMAARYGHTEIVELLLTANANICTQTTNALLEAIKNNHDELTEFLLDFGLGVDINLRDKDGNTALAYAISEDNIKLIKLLLGLGANVNTWNNRGETPLMKAVYHLQIKVIKKLLMLGAHINARDRRGYTALMNAIFSLPNSKSRFCKVLELLIARGADIDKQSNFGDTALMLAIKSGGMKTFSVSKLLTYNPDITKKNIEGKTALKYAKEYGYIEIVELLKAKAAQYRARAKKDKRKLKLKEIKKAFHL